MTEHHSGNLTAALDYATLNQRFSLVRGVPHHLTWGELHYPAPEGGQTLAEDWRDNGERIERLIYAVCGARPKQYVGTVLDPGPPEVLATEFLDWWHRQDPRCLWGPEQMALEHCEGYACSATNAYPRYYPYAARGDTFQDKVPRPKLPIRSRSGDPYRQMHDASRPHDRTYFPVASVDRDSGDQTDLDGRDLFDPLGTGDFGGDPASIGTDGDVHIDGVAVEVRYTPAAHTPDSVTLHWSTAGDSGSETMLEDGGVWAAEIPAQVHDTLVRWYLEAVFPPDDPEDPDVTRYEPGGATAPTTDQKYTYKAFSHWNPYTRGIPELWAKCKKGTDGYLFDASENIQPELINLYRFILDWIGWQYSHNPKNRSSLPGCCRFIPIVFRWSGSAEWPLLVEGGKSGVTPLHNLDETTPAGSMAARFSWRGAEYTGEHDNLNYGDTESWRSIPAELTALADWEDGGQTGCKLQRFGHTRGLRAGDVIEPAHLLEIIAATRYLVEHGLWTLRPIKRHMATPNWELENGYDCGNWRVWGEDPYDSWDDSYYDSRLACCEDIEIGDPGDEYGLSSVCIPFAAPESWEDCWAGEGGACSIARERGAPPDSNNCYSGEEFVGLTENNWEGTTCRGGLGSEAATDGADCGVLDVQGGAYLRCAARDYWPDSAVHARDGRLVQCGWAAYFCGPAQCGQTVDPYTGEVTVSGADQYHGNNWVIPRNLEGCPLTLVDTGRSHGNCYGEAWSCARRVVDGVPSNGVVDFEAVSGPFYFPGGAAGWDISLCNLDCESELSGCQRSTEVPAPPGMPGKWSWDETPVPICEDTCELYEPDPDALSTEFECAFSLAGVNGCMTDHVWVALDLNVDGTRAYGWDAEGENMPTLRDYDADPGAEYVAAGLYTDCPPIN